MGIAHPGSDLADIYSIEQVQKGQAGAFGLVLRSKADRGHRRRVGDRAPHAAGLIVHLRQLLNPTGVPSATDWAVADVEVAGSSAPVATAFLVGRDFAFSLAAVG